MQPLKICYYLERAVYQKYAFDIRKSSSVDCINVSHYDQLSTVNNCTIVIIHVTLETLRQWPSSVDSLKGTLLGLECCYLMTLALLLQTVCIKLQKLGGKHKCWWPPAMVPKYDGQVGLTFPDNHAEVDTSAIADWKCDDDEWGMLECRRWRRVVVVVCGRLWKGAE